jgi:ABC-type sugar transport systems, permease components
MYRFFEKCKSHFGFDNVGEDQRRRERRQESGQQSQSGQRDSGVDQFQQLFTRVQSFLRRDIVRSAPFWIIPFGLVGLFIYGAIIWNILLSLTDFAGLGEPDYSTLDFENYIVAFTGGTPSWSSLSIEPIWNATQNTIVLMIGFAAVCLLLGLVLAILVDQKIRFENTIRTIYLLPMSLSFVVTAKFWLYMYNPQTGLINITLQAFGIGPIRIVQNPQLKLAAVAFALVWQFSGYAMIVYLAALRAFPQVILSCPS